MEVLAGCSHSFQASACRSHSLLRLPGYILQAQKSRYQYKQILPIHPLEIRHGQSITREMYDRPRVLLANSHPIQGHLNLEHLRLSTLQVISKYNIESSNQAHDLLRRRSVAIS